MSFTENLSCDVAVVGAGPAGTSATYEIAKAWYKIIIIFEEDPIVGIPVQCGEGLSIFALQNLGRNPLKEFVSQEIGVLRAIFPNDNFMFIRARAALLRKGVIHDQKDPQSKITIDEIAKKATSNSIWNIAPVPPNFIQHPCPFPEEIPNMLITLYSNVGEIILDPFVGSGQTTNVTKYLKRHYIGIDNVPEYVEVAKKRLLEPLHLSEQLVAEWQKGSHNLVP